MVFVSDACVGPVTREDGNIVGQDIELFANGVEELLVASSGEVGPTNASGEKGISGKEVKFVLQVEGNRVRRMARDVG